MSVRLKITFTCFVLVLIALGCGLIYFLNTPYMKVQLFQGDRITGSFHFTVNNVEYDPAEASLEYENTGTTRLTTSGNNFSIPGGDYGLYKIIFPLENGILAEKSGDTAFLPTLPKTTPFEIDYINPNNWQISNIDINVRLTNQDEDWVLIVNIKYRYLTENYKTYATDSIEKAISYSEIAKTGTIIQLGV